MSRKKTVLLRGEKTVFKYGALFYIGGFLYYGIEIIWRILTHSATAHPAMFIVGGIAFIAIGSINEWMPWDMPLIWQCAIGTSMVYVIEFISGCILNLWLGLGVWDYSGLFMNLFGQICPHFAGAWFALSLVAILLDDDLRFILFDEDKPRYRLL